MRSVLSILLLLNPLFLSVTCLPQGSSTLNLRADKTSTDDQILSHWPADNCYAYKNIGEGNRDYSVNRCSKFCDADAKKKGKVSHGAECKGPNFVGLDPSTIMKDGRGKQFTLGKCACDTTAVMLAGEISKVVIAGLSQLDHILCGVMLKSFSIIAEIGSDFIPGAGEVNALKVAVKGAKTFAENAMNANDFFGDYINKACGMGDVQKNAEKIYQSLKSYPDTVGKSIGCQRPNKAECKKV